MNKRETLRGLYAITDSRLASDSILSQLVELALAGGAKIIQYRDKTDNLKRRCQEAQSLLSLCRAMQVPLIINDDVELAFTIGADGVHLGKEDDDIASARRKLGPEAIIGISCYNQFNKAISARAAGADYIAFGRFHSSTTKPAAVAANPGLLIRARKELNIPVVAIGGITPDNGGPLIAAGADMLAVVHAVFGQPDIRTVCENFRQLFEKPEKMPS
ncbi:thiamine phosphate synthase [Candidatus Vondammii sp. HM_W22]|uniref:thiamine phosphate synthase n=1 Tax=Candidatus Vondammii sp. HM_W22 TaxID=2687299 RepID=UPI001F138D23|nr:thiamine phosphate synthase [Candidatus Vondammii sp. HM_W22]